MARVESLHDNSWQNHLGPIMESRYGMGDFIPLTFSGYQPEGTPHEKQVKLDEVLARAKKLNGTPEGQLAMHFVNDLARTAAAGQNGHKAEIGAFLRNFSADLKAAPQFAANQTLTEKVRQMQEAQAKLERLQLFPSKKSQGNKAENITDSTHPVIPENIDRLCGQVLLAFVSSDGNPQARAAAEASLVKLHYTVGIQKFAGPELVGSALRKMDRAIEPILHDIQSTTRAIMNP